MEGRGREEDRDERKSLNGEERERGCWSWERNWKLGEGKKRRKREDRKSLNEGKRREEERGGKKRERKMKSLNKGKRRKKRERVNR